jgi:hypothetical protein
MPHSAAKDSQVSPETTWIVEHSARRLNILELRCVNAVVRAVLFPTPAVPFPAVLLLTRLGTDNVMSSQSSASSKEVIHLPDAHVATASWTRLTSRSPLATMPKLYFELRPPLAHSCTTTLLEKPVLLIFVMSCCSTVAGMPRTPDPAKRPRATELV